MSDLNRRKFFKLLGQGTGAVGIGLSGNAWFPKTASAQKGTGSKTVTKAPNWDEWEFYYPGNYNEQDAKIFKDFQAQIEEINNKEINIKDLISGKPSDRGQEMMPPPGPGTASPDHEMPSPEQGMGMKVTYEEMMKFATRYMSDIPLFNDRSYAKKTKYGNLIASPLILEPDFQPAMTKDKGFADYMVVSDHNDTMTFYRPVYEGDTLFTITDEQRCIDITPEAGSHYRTFVMIGRGRTFNQRGELVAEGANILKESFRRHKDPSKRNIDGAHAWESPDWWRQHPAHTYTDKDWEYLIRLWKKEKVRGSEVLYWDDVNIGNEPTLTVEGPILAEEEGNMLWDAPQWSADIKRNMLDPKIFATMVKNKQGIYVAPEHLEKKPEPVRPGGGGAVATPDFANRDGRQVFNNALGAHWAAGMLCKWMGDEGWLQRIGWDIMAVPPGSDKSIDYNDPKTLIPSFSREMMPSQFDKYPYMDKVPYMKGIRADCHGMEGDAVISRAYVTAKYKKDGNYFVDLTWWTETLDHYIFQEGFATVKLPKRS